MVETLKLQICPRACGEYNDTVRCDVNHVGPSPRVRGTHRVPVDILSGQFQSTPASEEAGDMASAMRSMS